MLCRSRETSSYTSLWPLVQDLELKRRAGFSS